MKLIKDTLKNGDTWSQKRLMTFSSFFIATIYAFVPVWLPEFEVKEFVFIGFLGAGGWSLFRTQKPNENINNENEPL
jgi:cbb3-type cytochrome oxidase subunit 3